jgi:hypothetical protein
LDNQFTQAASFKDKDIQLNLLCLSHQFIGVEIDMLGLLVSAVHGSCKILYVQVRRAVCSMGLINSIHQVRLRVVSIVDDHEIYSIPNDQ